MQTEMLHKLYNIKTAKIKKTIMIVAFVAPWTLIYE